MAVHECHDVDLDGTLRVLAMLPGDPTLRLAPGRLERATHTPDGPGTLVASWAPGGRTVEVRTFGPGADWLEARAPELLGLTDSADDFEPLGGPLRDLWRRHRGLRILRTGTVWHDACWAVVQQRIRRVDAAQQWRRLVERHGGPAPGHVDLMLPPSQEVVAETPSHVLHTYGIERRRADTLRALARSRPELGRLVERSAHDGEKILQSVPGIGGWTTAMLRAITWGDADTVILGDSGIPSMIAWTLAREPRADDARMLQLLEPYRPHRYRVLKLAFAAGVQPPRRRPYAASPDISRL